MSEENNIPTGWKWVKVSEICDVVRGGSPRPAGDPRFYDGNIPFLKVRDITKENNTYLTTFEFTIKDAGLHKTRQIKPNTLLLSNSGATLGVPKICMIDATMNDGIAAFLDLDKRSNLYLYYFWLSKTKELRNINMGAAQPNLNTDILKNYLVPYCSFEQQQSIVSKIEELLSDLENGKQQLQTAQQQLKIYRQSLLKWAFEGKLINKNVKDGELPKGWKNVQIKDVAETFGGYAFKSGEFLSKGKYQVLRMGNVRPGLIRYSESPIFLNEVDVNILNRSLLKIDDIIITQTGTRKKRDYGFTALIKMPNLLLNQRIASIRFNETYLPRFFLYYSWTDFFKDQFFANETGNVGQGNVGMKAVTETLIPFCTLQEQQLIVDELESKLTVCDKIEETISQSLLQAESLRQSILKKAFEGKLV